MYDCHDNLKLENQLCFPLYVCSKEVIRRYKPFLDGLDLTYTQYIAMMALWEHGSLSVKDLGSLLFLDSGTLTPLLKKLEEKGLVSRVRDPGDDRVVIVSATKEGMAMRDCARPIPDSMKSCISLPAEDAVELSRILKKLMGMFGDPTSY